MLGRLLLTLACGRLLFFIVASCAALELVARGPDDPVNQTLTFVKLGTGGVPELYPASTPRGSSMEVAVQSTATGCCTKSIIFSLTPFVCLVVTGIAGIDETPSVVSYFSAGTCTLRADQKGKKDKYNPAFKIQSIDVTSPPQPQTISFSTSAPVGAVVFSVYNVVVSATSNLAVTLSVSGPCSVSGNAVTHTGVGSCIVTANQAGNAAWLAAPAVQQTYSISKASQTISITSGPTSVAVGTSYTITAVATSLLPVTFTSSTTGVCTVASSTVTLASTGTCTLRADQAGDANYSPAPQATQSFTVGAAPQAISITSTAPTSPVVGQTYTPTATTNASLTVSFVSATLSVCSISGNIVTFDAVGVCTINFVQNGNGAFGPAPVLNQSMTVGPATQTLTITSTAVSPRVGGTYTVTTILSPNAALPVTFSTTTPTSCVVSGAVVTFSAVAQCTIVASQAGTANLQPVSTSQSVTPAKGTQTVSFVSAPPALLRIGTSYVSAATSTSNLPVDISVSAASAAVCTKDSGSTILLIGIGTCVLLADQPGDANWQPAAQGTQSLVVASLSAFSSPSQLAACTSVSACEGNLTGLTETFAAIEGGLVAQSSACLQPNCSSTPDLPWLTPCTQSYVSCVLNVTGQRVANLGNMLATLNTYSCNTSQCTASLGSARQRTTDQQQSLAFVCLTAQCQTVNSAAVSAQRVSSGAVNAVADEMLRFDRDLDRELLGRLYLDTWNYYQCSDGGCRDRYYALINESYAVQGYVVASEREGMEASNVSVVRSILDRLDAAYRPCALGPCDGVVFSTTRSTKRAHYTHLLQWGSRLSALLANCSGACDRAALAAASSSNDRSTFVASNYLPSEVSVAGIVIYSVIAAACIAVAVMAVVWQAFYGKMLFGLVLLAIFLAAVFRISFFAAAIQSGTVQVQYLTFVVLDKIGLIFFCLAILCFAAMWSQAISIMVGENSVVTGVIVVAAIVFAAAIFAIVIYFAVVVSVTYVTLFYSDTVTDLADIILSIITFFLAACLLAQILFVSSRVRASGDEEKSRNVLVIAVGLAVMVLLLAERVVVVLVYNFLPTTSLGYGVYYGIATILPEFVVSAVMLAIVLFAFSQASSSSSSSSGGSSTAGSSKSDAEMGAVKRGRYDTYK